MAPNSPVRPPIATFSDVTNENSTSSKTFVKIIYPGGHVEFHSEPVLASDIMSQNPKCWVTHPDVFQQPWAAVVKPDALLALGHKFYVVPISTVRKLRRHSFRNSGCSTPSGYVPFSSPSPVIRRKDGRVKGSCVNTLRRSFRCLMSADKEDDRFPRRNSRRSAVSEGVAVRGKGKPCRSKGSTPRREQSPKRRMGNITDPGTPSYSWQPSLESITEE
ncbi:hypothetical protein Cni_G17821 [Canna indica]|uniref:Uncharacterized protein n=1 Tax=Canna indica TaxID=4628 RepID=A0AAQ3KL57_9LILI|nr:hypothetical protein Cni_G17821 [Canna indica]